MKKVLSLILIITAFQGCRSLSFEEYDPASGKWTKAKWSSRGLFKTKGLDVKVGSMDIKSETTLGDAGEMAIAAGKIADAAKAMASKMP